MDDPNENPDDPPILELLQGREYKTKLNFVLIYIFFVNDQDLLKFQLDLFQISIKTTGITLSEVSVLILDYSYLTKISWPHFLPK